MAAVPTQIRIDADVKKQASTLFELWEWIYLAR